jgi:hypothetical protein
LFDSLYGFKYLIAKLIRFDGAYLRFGGQATVERFEGDRIAETVTENAAVCELMYPGHAPKECPGVVEERDSYAAEGISEPGTGAPGQVPSLRFTRLYPPR